MTVWPAIPSMPLARSRSAKASSKIRPSATLSMLPTTTILRNGGPANSESNQADRREVDVLWQPPSSSASASRAHAGWRCERSDVLMICFRTMLRLHRGRDAAGVPATRSPAAARRVTIAKYKRFRGQGTALTAIDPSPGRRRPRRSTASWPNSSQAPPHDLAQPADPEGVVCRADAPRGCRPLAVDARRAPARRLSRVRGRPIVPRHTQRGRCALQSGFRGGGGTRIVPGAARTSATGAGRSIQPECVLSGPVPHRVRVGVLPLEPDRRDAGRRPAADDGPLRGHLRRDHGRTRQSARRLGRPAADAGRRSGERPPLAGHRRPRALRRHPVRRHGRAAAAAQPDQARPRSLSLVDADRLVCGRQGRGGRRHPGLECDPRALRGTRAETPRGSGGRTGDRQRLARQPPCERVPA